MATQSLVLLAVVAELLCHGASSIVNSRSDDFRSVAATAESDATSLTERAFLQMKRRNAACPSSPQLDGQSLKLLIAELEGVLVVAIPKMRCTEAVKAALNAKGVSFKLMTFDGPFQYTQGQSKVWDWLHCTYPDDKSGGNVMHSYVFLGDKFLGNGFVAADKVANGELDAQLGSDLAKPCEERFASQAKVIKQYMADAKNKVLVFGWIGCPCMGIVKGRLNEKNICYEGRHWADPSSPLMAYLQCREKDTESHSFIYFRSGNSWNFAGNGFKFDKNAMSDEQLMEKVEGAGASTDCRHATVKVNVFGTDLEECQVGDDMSGSWMDDGTCSEEWGGIHQVCIEALPADFSSETHQSPWSKQRKGMRHCVCVGAWSLYMTDAAKHAEGARSIMPHCKAIPETTLTTDYLGHWRDWNGYPASVLHGVKELVSRCLQQAKSDKLKCGLKERFDKLRNSPEAKELKSSNELSELVKAMSDLSCEGL